MNAFIPFGNAKVSNLSTLGVGGERIYMFHQLIVHIVHYKSQGYMFVFPGPLLSGYRHQFLASLGEMTRKTYAQALHSNSTTTTQLG